MRETDERFGRPKSSAFRAFKRRRGSLREHVDFVVLSVDAARVDIARLRAAGCIYRLSVDEGILTESGFDRVRAEMEEG